MDAKPGPRLTLSTMLLAVWASAALLGTVAGAGDRPRAWPAPLALAVLSSSIVLPGVAIGVWRRASVDGLLAQVALTASFWDALWLLPPGWRFAAMVAMPTLGLLASAVARGRGRGRGRGGAWGLVEAASWNGLAALIAFVPIAFALNYWGWVRVR